MKRILTEPLVHFFILSLLFFGVYEILNPGSADDQLKVINISKGRVAQLRQMFYKTWSHLPTEEELDKVIELFALEEIYAREGRSLGLHKDDEVIRSRLRQKMTFMIEDMSALQIPSDDQLKEMYQKKKMKNTDTYKYSFTQVFISADQKQDVIQKKIAKIKSNFAKGQVGGGDNSLLPNHMELAEAFQIDRHFGQGFTRNLEEGAIGKWNGPFLTGLGYHFVRVDKKGPIAFLKFSKMKTRLLTQWRIAKRKTYKADFEKALLERYKIKIHKKTI